ncbi:MAG: phosphate ABC transporter permease PstA [Gammaproteobacteria bacterium]|nr:phosphate ABC transporter permease PstA [Gammaproteobacteria bacterium]
MSDKSNKTIDIVHAGLARRHRKERWFRRMGVAALSVGILFLLFLFVTIFGNGWSAFQHAQVRLQIELSTSVLGSPETTSNDELRRADYGRLIRDALLDYFPEVDSRRERRAVSGLVSSGAVYQLRDMVVSRPQLIGEVIDVWLVADDEVDMLVKGYIDRTLDESERRISNEELGWIDKLVADGRLDLRLNRTFLVSGDSRDPEMAGILGAATGSLLALVVTMVLAFPIGVAAAVYLEEFAPRSRLTDLIEVNINNLAAVPSIVFGLLGLAVLINFVGMPRSAPVVGGVVLALMTLPTIIIASRASLQSVPPSIREAALGMGASRTQAVTHHVLPLAMPGVLTGAILGMARALGETAPLLMIGMVAFVVDIPGGFSDPSTALPVQIFLWADSPERAFVEKTSAAIMVLLVFLLLMNLLAVYLRRKFERRW